MRSSTWFDDLQNPYHDDKVIAACGLFGVLDTSGRPMTASDTVRAIANMHDRNNGLGGGMAVYGLYPERADLYAIHVMLMQDGARRPGSATRPSSGATSLAPAGGTATGRATTTCCGK
jgi:glutamate synthase domain-containing protein 1